MTFSSWTSMPITCVLVALLVGQSVSQENAENAVPSTESPPNKEAASDLRTEALTALADGQYAKAVELAHSMIQQNPDEPRTLRFAADLYLRSGESELAVNRFDQLLQMEPSVLPELWQRGIALYFIGEYEKGARQFEVHRRINPYDVENAAWHYLCVAKAESIEAADKQLLPAPNDRRPPMAEILTMLQTGQPSVVAERLKSLTAGSPTHQEASFYADLYVGLYADAQGKQADALKSMNKAAKEAPRHYMGDVSRVYAKVLAER